MGKGSNLEVLVDIVGCQQSSLVDILIKKENLWWIFRPSLGTCFKQKSIWNPILEKVERRLVGWKRLIYLRVGEFDYEHPL